MDASVSPQQAHEWYMCLELHVGPAVTDDACEGRGTTNGRAAQGCYMVQHDRCAAQDGREALCCMHGLTCLRKPKCIHATCLKFDVGLPLQLMEGKQKTAAVDP